MVSMDSMTPKALGQSFARPLHLSKTRPDWRRAPVRAAGSEWPTMKDANVYILFAGWGSDGALGDTREFDTRKWRHFQVPGPTPRLAHQISYISALRVVALFGGRDGEQHSLDDFWTRDGSR